MADLNIRLRGTSQWVVDELDKIVQTEAYESRNQLINHILEMYVSSRSEFLLRALPEITREMCNASLEELSDHVTAVLHSLTITYRHIAKTADEIRALLALEKRES